MGLGLASVAMIGAGSAWLAGRDPAWQSGALSADAREVLKACGRGVLAGSLPVEPVPQEHALLGLIERTEIAIAAFPSHTQAELGQLLGVLSTTTGRLFLARLQSPWNEATEVELKEMLADMQTSRIVLRQQAYLGLHDLIGASYFSAPETWSVLDYPGPQVL